MYMEGKMGVEEREMKRVLTGKQIGTRCNFKWPLLTAEDEPPQTTILSNELSPPIPMHSRASIAEQDDQLPPLRPTRSLRSKPLSQRKMLVASYSDAADSAVSMVS